MYEKNLLERDIKLKEINNSKEQLALQIKEIQVAADSLQSSLESKKQRLVDRELIYSILVKLRTILAAENMYALLIFY